MSEERINEVVDELLTEHRGRFEEQMSQHFMLAAEDEISWLQSIGMSGPSSSNLAETDMLDASRERLFARVEEYDEQFRQELLEDSDRDESVEEVLDRVFTPGAFGGVVFDRTGETEPIKRVNPDGEAFVQDYDVSYVWFATPTEYFDWLTQMAAVEARNAGRVAVHNMTESLSGHVWMDPLDEESTPMSARLHGVQWDANEFPFLPPITHRGRAGIVPLFEEDPPGWDQQDFLAGMPEERETWFAQYHKMRRGEQPEENFTNAPVDVNDLDVSIEVIYRRYLPRDVTQYIPNNAE